MNRLNAQARFYHWAGFREQTHRVLTLALQTAASPNQSQSARNANAQRAGNTVRGGKRPAPGTKTPGAFLNNAKRWPVYGRTSGMRCVIARAERPWMALAPFRSAVFPVQARTYSYADPLHPTPISCRNFHPLCYRRKKTCLFRQVSKMVGERGLPGSASLPCGPLLKQRCLAALGSNLLRRFSSSLLQTKKNLSFQTGF